MAIYRTYIQQLSFNGIEYTKGAVVDLLEDFNIIAEDFPFKRFPKSKDIPTRDWAGEDGLDVYIPKELPAKEYEIDVTFLYKGEEGTIREDLSNFIDFLYGRNNNAVGSRLAIYNEHVGMGRKDVKVSEIEDDIFYLTDYDPDTMARFKVKFTVYDPTTEVTPTKVTTNGETTVTDLSFD